MYRDYETYLKEFAEIIAKNPGMEEKMKPRSKEQFLWENYRDKVEWYLVEEWGTKHFHDIFYENVDWQASMESEELTEDEERGCDLQDATNEIIHNCYENKECIQKAATLVLDYLKKEQAV